MSDERDRTAGERDDDGPDGTAGRRVPDRAVLDELSQAFDPTADAPRPGADDRADEARPHDSPADVAVPAGVDVPADVEVAADGEVAADAGVPADVEIPSDAEAGGAPPRVPPAAPVDDAPPVDPVEVADETDGGGEPSTGPTPLAPVLPIGEPRNLLPSSGGRTSAGAPRDDDEDGAIGDDAGPRTIKIGGDDELPDTVYLDDELARDDSDEQTVFIDDDGSSDAITATDATGSGIEPRLRQRRIGVRRAEGLRRLRWVIIAGGVALVVVGALAFLASPVFDIDDVSVVGEQYTDPDALQEVVDDLVGTPVLLADTADAEDRLEAIPWVESARVRTDFPNAASIEIRERTAVAAMPGADGGTRVLDRDGRILDVIEGQPIALVWIAGPITLDQPAGEFAPVGPSSAASLATKLTPTVRRRLDSILVTPDGADLRLMLRPLTSADADGDGTPDAAAEEAPEAADPSTTLPAVAPGSGGPLIEVRFGSAVGDNQQIEKLVRLERVLDDIGTDPVTAIDVSTAEVTIL